MKSLLKFSKKHPQILLFGILQIFFTAPGQTFLICMFVDRIFNSAHMSASLFASYYSGATLLGAVLLNPAGRLIDKIPTRWIMVGGAVLMAWGCWLLALSTQGWMIFLAFFILRFLGQGVFGLCASTLIGKSFKKNRGKAMGIITLGYPLSELVFPSIALLSLHYLGWRGSFWFFGFAMMSLMIPIQWNLLKAAKVDRGHFLPGELEFQGQTPAPLIEPHPHPSRRSKTLKDVFLDPTFYLVLAASTIPPIAMTGILFFQEKLMRIHQWPLPWLASAVAVYAIFKALSSVFVGPIVDKIGAVIPFTAMVVFMGIGSLLFGLGGPLPVLFLAFGIMGLALGISAPVTNVIWPNLYGVDDLGSIKGMISTFRNGLTALGPLPIAYFLDKGVALNSILIVMTFPIFVLAVFPTIASLKSPHLKG